MKSLILFLLIGFVISTSCSCCDGPKGHYSINIINNSENAIFFYGGNAYPDTTILDQNPSSGGDLSYKINGKTAKIMGYRDPIELRFKHSQTDTIVFFLFDANTLETMPWDIVMKKYLILQRFDVSLQDMQRLNWTITYPPTVEMKDIKMYPPYKK
jgi:hypothetical protein